MRALIALLLTLIVTPAFAMCTLPRVGDWGDETAAQATYAACLQLELNARAVEAQRQAQFEADARLRQQLFELEQRMRAQLATPVLPPVVAAF